MALDGLKQALMAFVFIAILGAAGAIALDEFNNDLTADSYADNVTDEGLRGIANSTGYLDTIGTLVGVGALVAVVVAGFWIATRR